MRRHIGYWQWLVKGVVLPRMEPVAPPSRRQPWTAGGWSESRSVVKRRSSIWLAYGFDASRSGAPLEIRTPSQRPMGTLHHDGPHRGFPESESGFFVMPNRVFYCCVALAAFCAAPVLATAISQIGRQSTRTIVTILLVSILIAFLNAALTRTWRRFFLVCFPLLLVSSVFAAYTVSFGVRPSRSLALVLLSTSWEEVVGFVSLYQVPTLVLGMLILVAVYFLLALRLPHIQIFSGKPGALGITHSRALLLASLPVTAYVASNPADLIDGIAINPVAGSVIFFAADVPPAYASWKGALLQRVPYGARRSGGEEVHILVIGESARRDSWSVYGYGRSTTPYLDKLKDEAIFLQDAVADANLTSWSVPIILTGITPEQFATAPVRGTLVDLAREAGYNTAWLINQDVAMTKYAGIHADHMTYPPQSHNIFDLKSLDGVLLPAYSTEIARAGVPRFIGIHVLGSHWVYDRRYPASFQRFGSAGELHDLALFSHGNESEGMMDAYDNSVAYTDWFLHQLIEHARALQVPVTLTFFPDHGEDVGLLDGTVGHGAAVYTRHAFEIPAFVWVNDAFRQAHPEKVTAMQANASKEIRSHDVFGTVADLMGISWPGANPVRSFASARFVPDTAMLHCAGGVLVPRQPRPKLQ
jgi:glucan phosphoethanolaminetransferase (alkaline phosphatase superfamily)